jgi:hypothetical protein
VGVIDDVSPVIHRGLDSRDGITLAPRFLQDFVNKKCVPPLPPLDRWATWMS